MNRWLGRSDVPRGDAYDARWASLAASGANIHGEADLVAAILARDGFALSGVEPPPGPSPAVERRSGPPRVLDAGCGTGRVAVELARRGCAVTGVDLDPAMLEVARDKAPHLEWVLADLASLDLSGHGGRTCFDLVAMPGNVMIFVTTGSEAAVLARVAQHLRPSGHLVAGFQLAAGSLALDAYDRFAAAAGLELVERHAGWDGEPFLGGDYAVSVHRRLPDR